MGATSYTRGPQFEMDQPIIQSIQDIDGCLAWAIVDGDLRTALLAALGNPQRLREIALIPCCGEHVGWARAANACSGAYFGRRRPGGSSQTGEPTSIGQVSGHIGHPSKPWRCSTGGTWSFPSLSGGGCPGQVHPRKLKLSAILDPTLDAEVVGMPEAEVADYEAYKRKFGDFQTPDTDGSKDQLSALSQVIAAGAAPYADFSLLFGLFGQRLLRRQTYMAFQLNAATGEWSRKEQPGPADFHSCYKTWKCYCTAMLLLEACESERLDAYSKFIRSQVAQFGDEAWSFISQADCRLRSQHMHRLTRQLRAEPQSGFTEASPWRACCALAIRDACFWSRELATPATLYLARHRREGRGRLRRSRRRGRTAGIKARHRDLQALQRRQVRSQKAQGRCKASTSHVRFAWGPNRLWPAPRPTDLKGSRGLPGARLVQNLTANSFRGTKRPVSPVAPPTAKQKAVILRARRMLAVKSKAKKSHLARNAESTSSQDRPPLKRKKVEETAPAPSSSSRPNPSEEKPKDDVVWIRESREH